jgi:hypothetical protein
VSMKSAHIWPLNVPAQIWPKTVNAPLREMENLKVNAFGYGYRIVDIVYVFYLAKIKGFSLLWATRNWKALLGFFFDGKTPSIMAVAFGEIRWWRGAEEVVVF